MAWPTEDRRLDAAVSLGIITAEQAAAIRALVPGRPAVGAAPSTATGLGYLLGAITVLVAMAWFLNDRWTWLGPWGVLAVVILYAAIFLLVARRLQREGQPVASGVLVLFAVLLTPIAVTALNEITGWTVTRGTLCYEPDFDLWACRGEEIVMELATVAVALLALRRVRFPLLVTPIVAAVVRSLFHATDTMFGVGLGALTAGWVWAVAAGVLTSVAYVLERRQPDEEDYARWLHIAAVISAASASLLVLGRHDELKHLLVPGAFVAFFTALRVRRFSWQLLGLGWFAGYLVWLASDVFSDTPMFPIILAALGVGMIVLTVWLQRNRERLVARLGALDSEGRPVLPGGVLFPMLVAVVAVAQLPAAAALDRADRRTVESRPNRPAVTADSARADSTASQGDMVPARKETPTPR